MALGKAPACPPCLTDLVDGLVWFPLLLTDRHFGVLLGEGCHAVWCYCGVQTCVCWKGHTKCSLELKKCVLPSLIPVCRAQSWVQLLASQSSGEREIHPYVPEIGCEETTALLLLLSPGRNFPSVDPKGETGSSIYT